MNLRNHKDAIRLRTTANVTINATPLPENFRRKFFGKNVKNTTHLLLLAHKMTTLKVFVDVATLKAITMIWSDLDLNKHNPTHHEEIVVMLSLPCVWLKHCQEKKCSDTSHGKNHMPLQDLTFFANVLAKSKIV